MELEEVKNYAVSKETTPLAKYIAGKLVELGNEHLKYVKNPYCFAGGENVGMSKAYQDILNKLHEEQKPSNKIEVFTTEQKLKFADYILNWLKEKGLLKEGQSSIDLERVEESCMAATTICEGLVEVEIVKDIGC